MNDDTTHTPTTQGARLDLVETLGPSALDHTADSVQLDMTPERAEDIEGYQPWLSDPALSEGTVHAGIPIEARFFVVNKNHQVVGEIAREISVGDLVQHTWRPGRMARDSFFTDAYPGCTLTLKSIGVPEHYTRFLASLSPDERADKPAPRPCEQIELELSSGDGCVDGCVVTASYLTCASEASTKA